MNKQHVQLRFLPSQGVRDFQFYRVFYVFESEKLVLLYLVTHLQHVFLNTGKSLSNFTREMMTIIKDFENCTVLSYNFLKISAECYQCDISISGYFQNLSGQGSEQLDLALKLALLRVGNLI